MEDGTRVSGETARRIACDAGVVRVGLSKDGRWREVEGKRQAVPLRLSRALQITHRGCRFPGCGFSSPSGHDIPEIPPRMIVAGVELGTRCRVPPWEEDVPLSFYLRALDGMVS